MNMIHVSKPLVTVINPATGAGELAVTSAPGITYRKDGHRQRARNDRRSRVVSARQQRKAYKALRKEMRQEAEYNQQWDNLEAQFDF